MAFHRTVVEDPVAQKYIDEEIRSDLGLSDLYDGLKWLLARDPHVGYPIPQTSPQVFVVRTVHWKTSAGMPPIVATYYFAPHALVRLPSAPATSRPARSLSLIFRLS